MCKCKMCDAKTIEAIRDALWWVGDGLVNADMSEAEWWRMKRCKAKLEEILDKCWSMHEGKWEKVEAERLITDQDNPELVYRLPSGFKGRMIKVYEDATELLTATYISK